LRSKHYDNDDKVKAAVKNWLSNHLSLTKLEYMTLLEDREQLLYEVVSTLRSSDAFLGCTGSF